MVLHKYIFRYRTHREVEIVAWNLYEAEVEFARKYGRWPKLAALVDEENHKSINTVYAFPHKGIVVYVFSHVEDIHQARALFEDQFGYRPTGGRLVEKPGVYEEYRKKHSVRRTQAQGSIELELKAG